MRFWRSGGPSEAGRARSHRVGITEGDFGRAPAVVFAAAKEGGPTLRGLVAARGVRSDAREPNPCRLARNAALPVFLIYGL